MSGYELQVALNEALAQNRAAIDSMREAGIEKAKANAMYRAMLAACLLRYRADGKLPATLLKDIAKGDTRVSDAAFKAECAEAEYEACREEVMLHKRECDVLREQIAREYSQAGWRD